MGIKIKIIGSEYHSLMIKRILGLNNQVKICNGEEPVDVVYHIFNDMKIESIINMFNSIFLKKNLYVIHWIGSDILNFIKIKKSLSIKMMVKKIATNFLNKRIVHWAGAPWLVDELNQLGINSIYIPLPFELSFSKLAPLPRKINILSYIPDGKEDFYGFDKLVKIASLNQDIQFKIIANSNKTNLKNIQSCGWISKDKVMELYDRSTCFLRMAKHDGLSLSVLEALSRGRYVIWNYKFPYTFFSDNIDKTNILLQSIKKIFIPNLEGNLYIKREFNAGRLVENFLENFKKLLINY